MTEQNPPTYTAGLGEWIRAQRLYTGLSQRGMAKHLGDMDRRSYQRIENGQDDCPPGLLDTVHELLNKFDAEVSTVSDAAVQEQGGGTAKALVQVPSDPREEWTRCVVSRAAVESMALLPVLVPSE